MSDPTSSPPPRYRWPKIALACVTLFFAACIFFMAKEVRRVQRIRAETDEMQRTTPSTNALPPAPAR